MNRFKRRFVALFIALALVLGVGGGMIAANEEPAAAHTESASAPTHNQDTYSYWYCSANRSNTAMTVIHSKVYGVWPGQIGYYCHEDFFGVGYQYWVIVQPPGSSFWYMPWNRQKCHPGGLVWCEEPIT
jgi:hypothetical protein